MGSELFFLVEWVYRKIILTPFFNLIFAFKLEVQIFLDLQGKYDIIFPA